MCAYQFILYNKTKPAYSIRIFFDGVPNLAFYFKCYNLPFFRVAVWYVDNCSLFWFFLHVILWILSQYVQNYRPTHEKPTFY